MRLSWFRIAMLVIVAIVVHDVSMATTGHVVVAAGEAQAEEQGSAHQHHQAPVAPEHQGAVPTDAPGHCDPLRVAASLNRNMSPTLDTAAVAVMPEPVSLMVFASTSRTIVEIPPAHPPDLNRAFFQVYLI